MERGRPLSDLRLPITGRALALFFGHVVPSSTSTQEALGRKVLGSGFRSAASGENSIVSVVDGSVQPIDSTGRLNAGAHDWQPPEASALPL